MDRKEAIKRLKEARNTIQPFRYVDEAIDYAVKVLEQNQFITISEIPKDYDYDTDGLEEYDEEEKEWGTWYDENGLDFDEHFNMETEE